MTIQQQHDELKAEYDRMQSLFGNHQIKSAVDWWHYQNVITAYRSFLVTYPAFARKEAA